jgi:hypothetical protein
MADIYRAREAFAFTGKNGVPRVITPGSLISADDPDYKGREHFFEPVEVAATRATETASASPGERRARSQGKPKEAPKSGTAAKSEETGS